jgi:hypothetical protein
VLIAASRCARGGAFDDERRIVVGDEVDHLRAGASLFASFAAGVAL